MEIAAFLVLRIRYAMLVTNFLLSASSAPAELATGCAAPSLSSELEDEERSFLLFRGLASD